jgi:hypothetical protein
VQTNPAGTWAEVISLLRKVSPPVKLMQESEMTDRVTQAPFRFFLVQTVILADVSCEACQS